MSHRVDIYLTLERLMLELDRRGDPAADAIRDVMDPIWYALSPAEHSFLDSRTIGEIHRRNPVTLSVEGIGENVLARNAFTDCATAIALD